MSERLTKIYTRNGDQGMTSLASGERIPKSNLNIEVLGTLDELNSALAVLITSLDNEDSVAGILKNIQHYLFDIGGEIAMEKAEYWVLQANSVNELEDILDEHNQRLPTLKEFILPGGNIQAAHTHLCRSICRRCERRLCELAGLIPGAINPVSIAYLNRLSDLLFVLSRVLLLNQGIKEVFWQPLRSRSITATSPDAQIKKET